MRRAVAGLDAWWLRGFFGLLALDLLVDPPLPWPPLLVVAAFACLALSFVRPPRHDGPAHAVRSPLRGRWVATNGPGTKVPSHGLRLYGQDYAVDLVRASGGASPGPGWGLRGSRPEGFLTWGAPVLACAAGTVVDVRDRQRDHRARDTWPSLVWLFTGEALWRSLVGMPVVVGNRVVLDHGDGTYSVHAHLRRGSARVRRGQRVAAGEQLGEVGTTGNTSEPHLHWQLVDHPDPRRSVGLPWRWVDVVETDEVERRWGTGERGSGARLARVPEDGVPPDGRVFEAGAAQRPAPGRDEAAPGY